MSRYSGFESIVIAAKFFDIKDFTSCFCQCGLGNHYNEIYRVQMPKITPHVCRHIYCSNMAKAGMNPKTLQYLMGHNDIGVMLNTYTHLGLKDAEDEMKRGKELEDARKELDKAKGEKVVSQKMFREI